MIYWIKRKLADEIWIKGQLADVIYWIKGQPAAVIHWDKSFLQPWTYGTRADTSWDLLE